MKNKFAAAVAAIALTVTGVVAPVAEAQAGPRDEWRRQQHHHQQQQRHHQRRDRGGNDGAAIIGGIIGGMVLGEILRQGGGQAPIRIMPPVQGGFGGHGNFNRHAQRCDMLQQNLDRTAYNLNYDGLSRQDVRQLRRLEQRMYDQGCHPRSPF